MRELERGKKKLNILGGMMLVRVVFFLAGAGIICRPVTGWVQCAAWQAWSGMPLNLLACTDGQQLKVHCLVPIQL